MVGGGGWRWVMVAGCCCCCCWWSWWWWWWWWFWWCLGGRCSSGDFLYWWCWRWWCGGGSSGSVVQWGPKLQLCSFMNVLFHYCSLQSHPMQYICQPLQVMPPLRHNQDLYILTTSSASQVLIDTWVGRGNLDSCSESTINLQFGVTKSIRLQSKILLSSNITGIEPELNYYYYYLLW